MPKTEEFGDIVVTNHENWVDCGYWNTYEWVGGEYVFFSENLLTESEREDGYLLVGPYKLELVEGYAKIQDRYLFRRVRDWKHTLRWHVTELIKKVKYRIIQTMVVWGLGRVPVATKPNFMKHTKIGRFLGRIFNAQNSMGAG